MEEEDGEGRKRNMKRQTSQEREHSEVSVQHSRNICASDSVRKQQKHARARKACSSGIRLTTNTVLLHVMQVARRAVMYCITLLFSNQGRRKSIFSTDMILYTTEMVHR